MRGKRWTAIAIAGVAFVVVAGLATGAIPGSGGVIQGCYLKVGGVLRVIDTDRDQKCTRLEAPISWNQQGPKGDKGDTGQDGAPGEDGTDGEDGKRGPSNAFTAYSGESIDIARDTQETVSSLLLPAGSYVLTGTVAVRGAGNAIGTYGVCYFDTPAEQGGFARYSIATLPAIASVSANSVVTLQAQAEVGLLCINESMDYDAVVSSSRVTALQVETLTDQS